MYIKYIENSVSKCIFLKIIFLKVKLQLNFAYSFIMSIFFYIKTYPDTTGATYIQIMHDV